MSYELLPCPLFPEQKALPAIGKSSDDIIQDQKYDQEHENNKSNLHHDLFYFEAEISPE
jgi:hypothetical protein